jgi:hypothetical protein
MDRQRSRLHLLRMEVKVGRPRAVQMGKGMGRLISVIGREVDYCISLTRFILLQLAAHPLLTCISEGVPSSLPSLCVQLNCTFPFTVIFTSGSDLDKFGPREAASTNNSVVSCLLSPSSPFNNSSTMSRSSPPPMSRSGSSANIYGNNSLVGASAEEDKQSLMMGALGGSRERDLGMPKEEKVITAKEQGECFVDGYL